MNCTEYFVFQILMNRYHTDSLKFGFFVFREIKSTVRCLKLLSFVFIKWISYLSSKYDQIEEQTAWVHHAWTKLRTNLTEFAIPSRWRNDIKWVFSAISIENTDLEVGKKGYVTLLVKSSKIDGFIRYF